MAVLWQSSLVPWLDPSGDPYTGAKAYFFDVSTTTPQTTYTDAALSTPHDHPVIADGNGAFPPIFLPDQSSHRLRITTADDVTIWDVDGISVPTTTPPEIPDSDTPIEQRFQTGDIKIRWAVSSPNGWVRVNGRTIGSATSGATERANIDCYALFVFLWNADSTLAVSGGRGANADSDWNGNKTIALPDPRGRALVILDSFGNSAANRISDAQLGADSDTMGAAGGSAAHTLTEAQLPSITPTFTGAALSAHGHPFRTTGAGDATSDPNGGIVLGSDAARTNRAAFTGTPSDTIGEQIGGQSAGTPAGTISSFGSGAAHNNLQPTIMIPLFIKL